MDTITKVIRNEGPLALFNGLEATVWRHAAWNGGYFGVIFGVRDVLPRPEVGCHVVSALPISHYRMLTALLLLSRPRKVNCWSTSQLVLLVVPSVQP